MGKKVGTAVGSIAILLVVGGAVLSNTVFPGLPGFHFGSGAGDSSDAVPEHSGSTSSSISVSIDLPKSNEVSEIRIDGNEIYFDNELCEDENDLKQKIIDIGSEREYTFVYDNAIKLTYDKVDKVLSGLESTLDVIINRQ